MKLTAINQFPLINIEQNIFLRVVHMSAKDYNIYIFQV